MTDDKLKRLREWMIRNDIAASVLLMHEIDRLLAEPDEPPPSEEDAWVWECPDCNGTGAEFVAPDDIRGPCPRCEGDGRVRDLDLDNADARDGESMPIRLAPGEIIACTEEMRKLREVARRASANPPKETNQ